MQPLSPTTPSHTSLKNKKNHTFLPWETTKLLPPISPKKTIPWISLHPKKKFTSLNPTPNNSFGEKGVELPYPPFTKKKILTSHALF